jgi:hypothetical protein
MTFGVRCPQCGRAFAFDAAEVPVQRAGRKGSRRWDRIIAYYPICPGCGEAVEVTDVSPAARRLPPDPPANGSSRAG